MQVKIIISQGHVKLANPLYLKAEAPIQYVVEIPDEAVAPTRDWLPEKSDLQSAGQVVVADPASLQGRYNQILGSMAKTRPATSIGDDFQTLQDVLEERYNGR